MIYGYLRVSTDEQDARSQKQGVDAFAVQNGWNIDEYISDEGVSGAKDPTKRRLGPLLDKINEGDVIICSEISRLGPLLDKINEGDVIICSEISRLGRDLYMVMDILHYCMEHGCKIYTVKDKFVLGDDIQSKVLAFAFGLSAEIERQMIRQRTKEGLKLRMKNGVLVGRPIGRKSDEVILDDVKDQVVMQYNYGVPLRRLAQNFNVDRNTITRTLHRWGVVYSEHIARAEKRKEEERKQMYKEDGYEIVELDREKTIKLIELDLTIPQIAEQFPGHTYEQIYDTILCDDEFNPLYRKHGQKKVKKVKY